MALRTTKFDEKFDSSGSGNNTLDKMLLDDTIAEDS